MSKYLEGFAFEAGFGNILLYDGESCVKKRKKLNEPLANEKFSSFCSFFMSAEVLF
jgi:hypothetical protein